jgi:glycerol uptake facilitator-like aquaporin
MEIEKAVSQYFKELSSLVYYMVLAVIGAFLGTMLFQFVLQTSLIH